MTHSEGKKEGQRCADGPCDFDIIMTDLVNRGKKISAGKEGPIRKERGKTGAKNCRDDS